jgi:hypothetical protein
MGCTGGCSVLFGLSVDDYSEGRGDAAVARIDGAPETSEPPPGDGSAASSPCAGFTHRFCDDFDQSGSLQSHGWATPDTAGGGHVAIDALDSRSPPQSVSMSNPSTARAALSRTFKGLDPAGDMHFAFDFRAQEAALLIVAVVAVGTYALRFGVDNNGAYNLDEWDDTGGQSPIFHTVTGSAVDAWTHFELVVHFVKNKASGSTITVLMNGASVAGPIALKPSVDTGDPRIEIGVLDSPASLNRLRFDNVVFDGP